jgi:OOP family OmpA-OmpF porin
LNKVALSHAALAIAVAASSIAYAGTPVKPHLDPAAPGYAWPAADFDRDGIYDRVDHCPDSPAGCTVDHYGCSIDRDGDGVCDGLDRCPDTPYGMKVDRHGCAEGSAQIQVRHAVAAAWAPAPIELKRKLFKFGYLKYDNKVFFGTGSSHLLPGGRSELRQIARLMKSYPSLRFEVGGHADSRGSAEYNLSLSQRRAQAVRAYLEHDGKVNMNQLAARGYGESQIVRRERSASELQANRRVEFRLTNPEALPRGVKEVGPHGANMATLYR